MDDKDSKFDKRQRSTSTNILKKISGREELDRAKARRYDPYSYESNGSTLKLLIVILSVWSIISICLAIQDYRISAMLNEWNKQGITTLPPSSFDPQGLIDFAKNENFECANINDLLSELGDCQNVMEFHSSFATAQDISFLLFAFLVISLLGCIFVFGAFTHRASRNLLTLRSEGQRFSPEMAVTWFFIPIMNLFKPWRVYIELFKGSDPSVKPGEPNWKSKGSVPKIIHFWELSFLLIFFFNPITISRIWFSVRKTTEDISSAHNALIIAEIMLAILGFLAMFLTTKLHIWQEKRNELIGPILVTPPKPIDPISEILKDDKKL
jgi:hypothetical protein